jgi:hypothetical protein
MTQTVGPALGHGLVMSQQGTGTTPGYDAIDVRRMFQGVAMEGVLNSGGFAVTQRGAGANMSVDIAATTGEGARVQGDAVTLQGLYYVPPASAVINETIAAADATNPRNDLVVLEIKDTQHDASGSNLAQTRVVTGTPNVSATQTDAYGVNGTPALPASAIPLAVVNVPALDTAITTSQVSDRRPFVWRFGGSGGKSIITATEARSNVAYGTLTTPDIVKSVVLPTDGLIGVLYQATWQESVNNAARAAIFLNSVQQQIAQTSGPANVAASRASQGAGVNVDGSLFTAPTGLCGTDEAAAYAGDATTGQAVGWHPGNSAYLVRQEIGGSIVSSPTPNIGAAGPCYIFATAGTYDVSVQFKASSGSVTAKNRKLWVWTQTFGG